MIRPLHDYVFAKRLDSSSDRTAGGLFIPEGAKEKPSEAEIFAVGPGLRFNCPLDDDGDGDCPTHKARNGGCRLPMSVKVGDHVLFGKWSGSEIKIEGETYLIMREAEILGIIK